MSCNVLMFWRRKMSIQGRQSRCCHCSRTKVIFNGSSNGTEGNRSSWNRGQIRIQIRFGTTQKLDLTTINLQINLSVICSCVLTPPLLFYRRLSVVQNVGIQHWKRRRVVGVCVQKRRRARPILMDKKRGKMISNFETAAALLSITPTWQSTFNGTSTLPTATLHFTDYGAAMLAIALVNNEGQQQAKAYRQSQQMKRKALPSS